MQQNEILSILRSWYLIEMLSPRTLSELPSMLRGKHPHLVFDDPAEGIEMTWERKQTELELEEADDEADVVGGDSSPVVVDDDGPSEETEKGYVFYLGIGFLSDAFTAIRKLLGVPSAFSDDERRGTDSFAFASVRITHDGLFVRNSLTISTLPWYLARMTRSGLTEILTHPVEKGFNDFLYDARLRLIPSDDILATATRLRVLAQEVVCACGLPNFPITYWFAGRGSNFEPNDAHDVINSFYYEDIAEAIDRAEHDALPPLLNALFAEPDPTNVQDDAILDEMLTPATLSPSHWPNKSKRPSLMQHVALIVSKRPDAGLILAVNGPPGTGKTTLLRSFVTENVVRRAEALQQFTDPTEAWSLLRAGETAVHALDESITGYEMVVASANNGAIENVTKDIPLLEHVEGYEDDLKKVDYFSSVAKNVANFTSRGRLDVQTWGLLSAALGNKTNRSNFIEPLLHQGDDSEAPSGDAGEHIGQFNARKPAPPWPAARAAFEAASEQLRAQVRSLSSRDPSWDGLTAEAQQLRAPFVDEQIAAAQAEVFLAALVLHRSFIQTTWATFSQNLSSWAAMAKRPHRDDFTAGEQTALWRSLFLLCPVISTTFASVRQMMPKVKHNALGWVLIDEAGQVPAQQATGILMRARRAMIIGDPLQLEPIVTLSPSIVACIRDVFGAHDRFVSHEDNAESLQTIADRASKYCSFRSAGQSDAQAVTQRIGIPLLVHRRCMKPMFSISNAIYGNQMVYAVNEMAPWDDCLPGVPSAWIDERSDARRHSVPQQVELVEKLVVRMSENFLIINEGQPLQPSIYVITPFREIEEKLKEAFSKYPDLSKWAKRGIGTIHKFQGKEADIVIVVLGLSAGNEFALQFAVAKPNMMNVAVTRAKRRLYVIGNAELWGDQKYFGDVYETMLAQGAVYDAASFTATVIDPIPVLRVLPKPKKPKASRKKAVR